ncbi:MAG: hypothetical protein F4018_06810 [Acidobacteria bacterium]|nr:hypothetical protein [Acidobacteriota bacterium]MYH28749.1 hypothetical protein [Acidobacteriota bacterium]MYK88068.1 hypothetical protein [Acidobacteriota bacterium]
MSISVIGSAASLSPSFKNSRRDFSAAIFSQVERHRLRGVHPALRVATISFDTISTPNIAHWSARQLAAL